MQSIAVTKRCTAATSWPSFDEGASESKQRGPSDGLLPEEPGRMLLEIPVQEEHTQGKLW